MMLPGPAVSCSLTVLLALAATGSGGVLFQDDFDDGDADGWHEASMCGFDVIEGMYRMYGGYEENHGISFNGDMAGYMSTPDYSTSVLVLPETGTFFGMMARFRLENPYNIMLVLDLPQQRLRLLRWNWSGITLLDQTDFTVEPWTAYMVRLEVAGSTFSGRAWTGPDEPAFWMVSASDTLSSAGSLALFCAGVSDASLSCMFDDVVISQVPSALESRTWGFIKSLHAQ